MKYVIKAPRGFQHICIISSAKRLVRSLVRSIELGCFSARDASPRLERYTHPFERQTQQSIWVSARRVRTFERRRAGGDDPASINADLPSMA